MTDPDQTPTIKTQTKPKAQTHRLQLSLGTKLYERVAARSKKTGNTDNETGRRALNAYLDLTDRLDRGDKLIFEKPDGTQEAIIVVY